jgi:hypothetical protein
MNVPALKAALEQFSSPTMDPNMYAYCHTYPNGYQEHISFSRAAEKALERIEALEAEIYMIYADPDVKYLRMAKRKKAGLP